MLIIVQEELPSYRLDFFDRLAALLAAEGEELRVYRSAPAEEGGALGILTAARPPRPWERLLGPTAPLTPLAAAPLWQRGALSVPLRRGDVLVAPGAPRCLSHLALMLKARLRGARVVWWGHYWSATSRPWRFWARVSLTRLAHVALFYTDLEVREALGRARRLLPREVRALSNGLNLDPIAARRAPFTPAERARAVLFIGRLLERSELPVLLRALARPALAHVSLEVVGGGPAEEDLRALATALGVGGRVRWRGATVDEGVIAEVANRCRLFVYPGAVGLSVIHAMAYGLPCVLHDDRLRQGPEVAAHEGGVTGLWFRQGDDAGLAAAVAEALADDARLARWSAACVRRVEEVYNTAEMARRMVAVWRWGLRAP